ncbi:MAG: phospholipid carrier-dependent glycosyltransferase [Candidatus Aenigmarchaeota archaeon]|nr:phospholipid carrier-dependent glycosyltransferase [Candidatus Aenigmarchaeota archaeon]
MSNLHIFGDNNQKYLYFFLIFCILFGIFFRFYDLGSAFMFRDEPITFIGGIKLHYDNPYDGRLWNYEHPAVAKWFIGLPTRFIATDYNEILQIPTNMYVWLYVGYEALSKTYVAMRLLTALFGVLSLALIFLITRELYGTKAGLWSTVIAALSFDLILYSRITFYETYLITFFLSSIFLYIKYLKTRESGKRILYMALTFVFVTLTIGTRSFNPLFIIPILLLSQFIINRRRMKENLLFIVLLIVSLRIVFFHIYPPEIRDIAQAAHGITSLGSIMGFSLIQEIMIIFSRNSYLFIASILITIYSVLRVTRNNEGEPRRTISLTWIKESIKNPKPVLIISIAFWIIFLGFGFSRYGTDARYLIILFLPLFIMAGKPMIKMAKNKMILSILIILIIVNMYGIVAAFPYFGDYSNFGDPLWNRFVGTHEHQGAVRNAMKYLESQGNPSVVTSEPNILIFYPGDADSIPIPNGKRCNPSYIEKLKKAEPYVVYNTISPDNSNIENDMYTCPAFRSLPMTLIESFEPDNSVRLYKITNQ